jgi:hypothetical protein
MKGKERILCKGFPVPVYVMISADRCLVAGPVLWLVSLSPGYHYVNVPCLRILNNLYIPQSMQKKA